MCVRAFPRSHRERCPSFGADVIVVVAVVVLVCESVCFRAMEAALKVSMFLAHIAPIGAVVVETPFFTQYEGKTLQHQL